MGIKKEKKKNREAGICSHLKSCKLILFSNSPLFTKTLLGMQKWWLRGALGCLSHYSYSAVSPALPCASGTLWSGLVEACLRLTWDQGQLRHVFLYQCSCPRILQVSGGSRGCQGLLCPQTRRHLPYRGTAVYSPSSCTCCLKMRLAGVGWGRAGASGEGTSSGEEVRSEGFPSSSSRNTVPTLRCVLRGPPGTQGSPTHFCKLPLPVSIPGKTS